MKTLIDFILSIFLLILFSPVILIVTILIYLKDGSPVFFLHPRLGKNHQKFNIIKFRTMSNAKDKIGNLLPDKERTTNLGNLLRRTSLDEIPGLVNVIKGEMSLVGPRPLPPQYLSRYSKEQDRRHSVKPGVTGWAQINGRNAISWEEKFRYDIWYIENQSIFLDLKILFLTIGYVLSKKDIIPTNKDFMEEFMGNKR